MKVLDLACRQLQVWNETLDRDALLRCSVNFSARQLAVPTLVRDVSNVLARYAVRPEQLVLEITESALIRDPEAISHQLGALTDLGVTVAIDDFGTG
jgi:EAL domain-containing protein (putative c-di-GMP-specific phosphodiesterase class I)